MKSLIEFTGISKRKKEEYIKEYLYAECKYILISYIFIFLSSTQDVVSWKNGAIYVFIWFTLSVILSVLTYVNQRDFECRRKKAVNYSRHKRVKVIMGTYVKPEIGGWTLMGMFYVVACLICLILLVLAEYLQFKDINQYMEQYKDLCLGIFTDTYIVTFFGIISQLLIDDYCESTECKSGFKTKLEKMNCKNVLCCVFSMVIAVFAIYYFLFYEFKGLFVSDFIRRSVGIIYIIFLIYPGIKQVLHVRKSRKN